MRSPPVLPVLAALRRIFFQHSAAVAVYISLPPALGAPPTPVNGSGGGWKLGEARLRQNIPAVAAWNGNPAREAGVLFIEFILAGAAIPSSSATATSTGRVQFWPGFAGSSRTNVPSPQGNLAPNSW